MTPRSRAQLARLLHAWRAGGVEHYDIGALDHQTGRLSLRGPWTLHQVMRACGWMAARNATGSSIFARPASSFAVHPWILVPELDETALVALGKITPLGAVVEASPGSFQAWIRVKPSQDERTRTALARGLARRVGARAKAGGGSPFGRVPGTTNREAQLRQPDGGFPFAALRRAAPGELTRCESLESLLEPTDWPEPTSTIADDHPTRPSDTKRDFAVACRLVETGRPDHEVAAALRAIRDFGPEEQSGYITRTVAAARKHVDTGLMIEAVQVSSPRQRVEPAGTKPSCGHAERTRGVRVVWKHLIRSDCGEELR